MKMPKENPRIIEIGFIGLFFLIKIEARIKIEPKVWGIKYFMAVSLLGTEKFFANMGIKIIKLISIITHKENHEVELIAKREERNREDM